MRQKECEAAATSSAWWVRPSYGGMDTLRCFRRWRLVVRTTHTPHTQRDLFWSGLTVHSRLLQYLLCILSSIVIPFLPITTTITEKRETNVQSIS
jgi:hypothetical protein